MRGAASEEARSYGRAAGLLTGTLATAGALAYLFFAVASHNLPSDEYGQIVVLWSVAFLVISTLFRPVEQLLAKSVADLEERGLSFRHVCRVAALIQAGLGIGFIIVAFALKGVIEDRLFEGDSLFFWSLIGTVLALSLSYFARGYFAGSRQMAAYSALLLVEGLARLGLALSVAVGVTSGTAPVALAIAIGPAVSLAVVPIALAGARRVVAPSEDGAPSIAVDGASEFTLAHGSGFAGAVLLIMLSEQVLLNSGVLFVRASESTAAAGFIFNVLMVARAPVVLFQAIAASLLPHLTRLRSRGDEASGDAFALSIRLTLTVIAGFTIAVLIGLLAIGPAVMQIAFGDSFTYDRLGLCIVALGMGLYLTAGTLNQAALARGQVRRAAACWIACALVFATANLLPVLDAFRRVEVGFAVSAGLLCAGLYGLYRRPGPAPCDGLKPGSSQELEARLAFADEAVQMVAQLGAGFRSSTAIEPVLPVTARMAISTTVNTESRTKLRND